MWQLSTDSEVLWWWFAFREEFIELTTWIHPECCKNIMGSDVYACTWCYFESLLRVV